jgi:DHA1 family inner membrane transport protein
VAFLTAPEARGRAISKVFGGFALSNVIGLPLGVLIAAVSDWHVALWYAATVSAAAAIMVGKYLPRNIQVPPSNFAVLGAFLLDWRKMAVVFIVVLQMAAVFTVYTYLTAWLTQTLGLSQQAVTWMLLWFGLFGTIGVFSSGELMQRFDNHKLMVVLLVLLAVIHSSFSWIPASILLVMLVLAMWGVFGFAFQPMQQTRVIQVAGTSANAGITLHASGVYVGQAFGAFVGGAMLAAGGGGMSSLGWTAAAVAMAALGLMLITFRTTRNQIPAK